MNTKIITALILMAAPFAFAGDLPLFELRLVAGTPSATTKEYSLPEHHGTSEKLLLESAVLFDAKALKSAQVAADEDGNPSIAIQLTETASEQFGEITTRNVSRRLGLIVAGQLRVAPVIRQAIWGGRLMISGTFTAKEAAELVSKLNGKKTP